jgi:hypothetical protein
MFLGEENQGVGWPNSGFGKGTSEYRIVSGSVQFIPS